MTAGACVVDAASANLGAGGAGCAKELTLFFMLAHVESCGCIARCTGHISGRHGETPPRGSG